jgi:phosphoglycerate dehydrogenase-like enzyme
VERTPITKLVVSLPFRDDQFADLRSRFPDIDIVQCELNDIRDHIQGAQATFSWRLPADAVPNADKLVWMQGGGAGVESLLTTEFVARNILLTNASGVSAPNMAEHAIAMVLAFARGIPRHVIAGTRHKWRDETLGSDDFELGGQTAFVVGTGAIGSEIARRLKGLDVAVIGVRRNPERERSDWYDTVIGVNALPDQLGEADHVISSLPLTPDTRHLFDAKLFSSFKTGSYFYNLGRGGTVVQDDLIAAIQNGHLSGAGLDVVDPEPLPEDHPLWDVPGVLITSHQSGGSNRTIDRLFALAMDNLERYTAGKELRNVVDQTAGY